MQNLGRALVLVIAVVGCQAATAQGAKSGGSKPEPQASSIVVNALGKTKSELDRLLGPAERRVSVAHWSFLPGATWSFTRPDGEQRQLKNELLQQSRLDVVPGYQSPKTTLT